MKVTSELCFATSCWTLCTQWALKKSITKRAFFVLSVAKPHFLDPALHEDQAYNYQAYISYEAAAAVSRKNLQDTVQGLFQDFAQGGANADVPKLKGGRAQVQTT